MGEEYAGMIDFSPCEDEVDSIITSCDFLSPIQKKFYIKMLRERREKILKDALSSIGT